MKRTNMFRVLGLLIFLVCTLCGEAAQKAIPFFERSGQSNILVTVCDFGSGVTCPPAYVNELSNTNLFSTAETNWLNDVLEKYRNVTTNVGPAGTVLRSLHKTNVVDYPGTTNSCWVASFQHTNSDAREEIWFLGAATAIQYRAIQYRDGIQDYFVSIPSDQTRYEVNFMQFQNERQNGLRLELLRGRPVLYARFTNGMAIGKCFMWNPENGNLRLQAEFKEPFDWNKHMIRLDQR